MLHVTKVTLELRFVRGYRCEEGAHTGGRFDDREMKFEAFHEKSGLR